MTLPSMNHAKLMAHPDWLTVDDAATATGVPIRTWQDRASKASCNLATKAPPKSGRGKPVWWIHRSLDDRLTRAPKRSNREDRHREALDAKHPRHKVETAYRRARWLNKWRQLCESRRSGERTERDLARDIVREAREAEGSKFRISFRTLQQWRAAYMSIGPDAQILGVEGLIDRRGGCATGGSGGVTRSPEAVEYFYSLYHTPAKPAIKTCHDATLRRARTAQLAWPATCASTVKWLAKHDDLATTCLMREGFDVWARRYMGYLDIDYTLIDPGMLYVCDHTQCDFWIESRGNQLRPWLTAILDCRSRCVVGWNLGVSPNQDAIIAAMRMAFGQWAIPEKMRIDNGKDFTSKLLTGVTKRQRDRLRVEHGGDWTKVLKRDAELIDCVDPRFTGIITELDVELIYAIPYAPWAKGIVERWFGTFHGQCGKTFATYCGSSVLSKPDCLETIRHGYTSAEKRRLRKKHGKAWKKQAILRLVDPSAVPTLDEARTAIGEYIEVYHNAAHSGDDMAGATPLGMWATATSLRRAEPESLLLMMQARGVYKVGANGVTFQVGGHRMSYGAAEPRLYRHRGRGVFITCDPNDVSCCFAYTPERDDRRFIARLDCNERIAPNASAEELREAIRKVEGRRKVGRQAQRSAAKRMRTVAQELTAQRRERVAEIRATGTDDVVAVPAITPVRTGFERATHDVRTAASVRSTREPIDVSAAKAALSLNFSLSDRPAARPRVSDSLLGPIPSLTEERQEDDGTDAGDERDDAFGVLIGADRHERATEQ